MSGAADIAVVGAGAAGLATAIFAGRSGSAGSVLLFDTSAKPGAKILISGGTRCNVTNRTVTERDFWGGRPAIIRRVLRAFTSDKTVEFFRGLGVPLHEEANGKLFPDSGRARDVLNALFRGVESTGARLLAGHRVVKIEPTSPGFLVVTNQGTFNCRRVVLATGGQSLPKTGSDGGGYEMARRLGHTIVPTTPALAPLVLDETDETAMHRALSGVSHDAEIAVWVENRVRTRLRGSLLWTHFGISGPVALDASRHWARAVVEGRPVRLTASFCPDETFERLDEAWIVSAAERPNTRLGSAVAAYVPAAVADAMLERLKIDAAGELAHLTRAERRTIVGALVEWPFPVAATRGYNYAEATAGGVSLDEIDAATMESRVAPGLYLVGEVLDVDGRIGGFNFQWAWSTAYVAGRALSRWHAFA